MKFIIMQTLKKINKPQRKEKNIAFDVDSSTSKIVQGIYNRTF